MESENIDKLAELLKADLESTEPLLFTTARIHAVQAGEGALAKPLLALLEEAKAVNADLDRIADAALQITTIDKNASPEDRAIVNALTKKMQESDTRLVKPAISASGTTAEASADEHVATHTEFVRANGLDAIDATHRMEQFAELAPQARERLVAQLMQADVMHGLGPDVLIRGVDAEGARALHEKFRRDFPISAESAKWSSGKFSVSMAESELPEIVKLIRPPKGGHSRS